jgi:hypothetical protein
MCKMKNVITRTFKHKHHFPFCESFILYVQLWFWCIQTLLTRSYSTKTMKVINNCTKWRVFKQISFISTLPFSPKSKSSNTLTQTRTWTCYHQILVHPFQILHHYKLHLTSQPLNKMDVFLTSNPSCCPCG